MSTISKILQELKIAKRSAFSTIEIAGLYQKNGKNGKNGKKKPNTGTGYIRLMLHRSYKKGEIKKVKNGWWALADSMGEAVACEVSKPAYISFHSALYLHGLTTQIPRKIQLATLRKPKKYTIDGTQVVEYKIKKENFNTFYLKDSILLASKEKAFTDCLILPRTCPEMVLIEVIGNLDLNILKSVLNGPVGQAGRVTQAAKNRLKRLMRTVDKYAKTGRAQ